MKTPKKAEARPLARLLCAETQVCTGWLYLWDSGEIEPLWIRVKPAKIMIVALPGEDVSGVDADKLVKR